MEAAEGESVVITNKDFILHYVKPCVTDKGKKMAKLKLRSPPKDILERLEKSGIFDEMKSFPELGTARAAMDGKQVLIFSSGEISIRQAKDRHDVAETVRRIVEAVKGK